MVCFDIFYVTEENFHEGLAYAKEKLMNGAGVACDLQNLSMERKNQFMAETSEIMRGGDRCKSLKR